MCTDKWTGVVNSRFPALWVYGFMSLSPHASLSETVSARSGAEARLTAVEPRVLSHRADLFVFVKKVTSSRICLRLT